MVQLHLSWKAAKEGYNLPRLRLMSSWAHRSNSQVQQPMGRKSYIQNQSGKVQNEWLKIDVHKLSL
jgi:hypothetical protein